MAESSQVPCNWVTHRSARKIRLPRLLVANFSRRVLVFILRRRQGRSLLVFVLYLS